jgi:hypothetical protein
MSQSTELMLETWGAWSRGDLGGMGMGRGGDSMTVCCTDDEMLVLDAKIARMGWDIPLSARVIKRKYLSPELGENGEAVPRSDVIVAAMLKLTQVDVNDAILTGIRYIENE